MKRKYKALLASAIVIGGISAAYFPAVQASAQQVHVSDTAELLDALANAKAGDEIILKEGIYQNDKWTGKWAAFWAEADGTPEQHIILRSEDAEHSATICGVTQENKYALNIIGSY